MIFLKVQSAGGGQHSSDPSGKHAYDINHYGAQLDARNNTTYNILEFGIDWSNTCTTFVVGQY